MFQIALTLLRQVRVFLKRGAIQISVRGIPAAKAILRDLNCLMKFAKPMPDATVTDRRHESAIRIISAST
ncbi:hypothetical protein [Burkholderia ubonensis]|nr:hypothetical protein [Burkholderia ubonensis]